MTTCTFSGAFSSLGFGFSAVLTPWYPDSVTDEADTIDVNTAFAAEALTGFAIGAVCTSVRTINEGIGRDSVRIS